MIKADNLLTTSSRDFQAPYDIPVVAEAKQINRKRVLDPCNLIHATAAILWEPLAKAHLFVASTSDSNRRMRYANAVSLYASHHLYGRFNCHRFVDVDHSADPFMPTIRHF